MRMLLWRISVVHRRLDCGALQRFMTFRDDLIENRRGLLVYQSLFTPPVNRIDRLKKILAIACPVRILLYDYRQLYYNS